MQLTSAGTALYHSETAKSEEVHLVEVWCAQGLSSLAPAHFIRSVTIALLDSLPRGRLMNISFFLWGGFRHFSDQEKKSGWICIAAPPSASPATTPTASLDNSASPTVVSPASEEDVSPSGTCPAPIRSPMRVYATLLHPGTSRQRVFSLGTKGYIHVIQTSGYNQGAADPKGVRVKCSIGGGGAGSDAEVEAELMEGDGAYMINMRAPGAGGEEG